MTEACTAGFAACCALDVRRFLCGMSLFFAYGAEVAPKELIGLATVLTLEELKKVFLGGVAYVDNPFIPGVRCGVALCLFPYCRWHLCRSPLDRASS